MCRARKSPTISHDVSNLMISALNVNGLSNKLECPLLLETVNNYDIIILTETWLPENKTIEIDGYSNNVNLNIYRKKQKRERKCSGGIAVIVKNNLIKGVSMIKKNSNIIWLKLRKSFFNMEQDIFIGGVYLPPQYSSYNTKHLNYCKMIYPNLKTWDKYLLWVI